MTEHINKRIYLSPPHMSGYELEFIQEAFESNYIAPLGPMVDGFERDFCEKVEIRHAVAISSGTAAMHLVLRLLGIGPGDEVIASDLTFIGGVTPIVFQGATPVFIDCDRKSWNMDPDLLFQELKNCDCRGKLPKAVIPTDLYGQCCNYDRIFEICDRYDVPVIADSAEALGARYQRSEVRSQRSEVRGQGSEVRSRRSEVRSQKSAVRSQRSEVRGQGGKGQEQSPEVLDDWMDGRLDERYKLKDESSKLKAQNEWIHAGKRAKAAVFSFNGNKIITTSGGGVLVSDDKELIEYARFLSQQARDSAPHYEHSTIGYNYRMSNVLAAIGRGQLKVLEERVNKKRNVFKYYERALGDIPGIEFMPEPEWSRSNRWLSVILITPEAFGADRERVRLAMEAENIESRPVWKPMHIQPVFRVEGREVRGERRERKKYNFEIHKGKGVPARVVGGNVAEDLFDRGLCLPSGTALTDEDLERVVGVIKKCRR